MNEPAQSARGRESACGFCGRPWFGLVAYCPYCGRKANITTSQRREHRPPSDKATGSGPENLQTQAGAPRRQKANPPSKEPGGKPLQGAPVPASTHRLKTVAAGVSVLLLLWMAVKLFTPGTNEEASPKPPITTSGIASPRPVPATSAAQVPSIPRRTGNAVPSQSNRSLCSVANEAAGLCKVQ
jgi:hypothetical protein